MTDEAQGQSTRAGGNPPLLETPQYIIEGIILRRLHEKRIEGYTIETAKEIAEALASRPSLPAPGREEIAKLLWHRFAPVGHIEWNDESHRAEYLDAADAILALSRPPENVDHRATEPAALRSAGGSDIDPSEQVYLEDNIQTVAFHLGQPGASLSVSVDGSARLLVDPGEVLKEVSRRLQSPSDSARLRSAGRSDKPEIEDDLAFAIEMAQTAHGKKGFRSHGGCGGIWYGRNEGVPDANFTDWELARAVAIILNAVVQGRLARPHIPVVCDNEGGV